MSMLQTIENSVLEIRGTLVILDSDVAAFYGVETMRVNEAPLRETRSGGHRIFTYNKKNDILTFISMV